MTTLSTRSTLIVLLSILFIITLNSCDSVSSNQNDSQDNDSKWLIPVSEVVDGGPGKDGIPSIDAPKFIQASEAQFVNDDRMVTGIKVNGEVRLYPHQIMDWHEIVNDEKDNLHYSLTYCPLTGTAIAFNRDIQDQTNEFGVSGLLFRNNLIMYDRNTGSRWSQMQMRAVNGHLIGEEGGTIQTIQTTWSTWKKLYGSATVLSTDTGFNRNYQGFTYGSSYSTDNNLFLFEPIRNDSRLPNKALVHAVFPENFDGQNTKPRIYSLEDRSSGIEIIEERFDNRNIIFVGSSELNFGVSFESTLDDGTQLTFHPVEDELPVIMEDEDGSKWTIFGEAVSGPRQGQKLNSTNSYNGYWFAFANFYKNSCVYPNTDC